MAQFDRPFQLAQSIGFDKAAQIAWFTVNLELFPTAQFIDAKMGSVKAAKRLYGECSNEAKYTLACWNKVGVTGFITLGGNCYQNLPPITEAADPERRTSLQQGGSFLEIVPVPARDNFELIYSSDNQNAEYTVYNMMGQAVLKGKLMYERKTSVASDQLSAGTYQLVVTHNKQHFSKRIIISR